MCRSLKPQKGGSIAISPKILLKKQNLRLQVVCDFICNRVSKQKQECHSHKLDFEINLMSERCVWVCGGLIQPSMMAGNKEWMRITVNAILF